MIQQYDTMAKCHSKFINRSIIHLRLRKCTAAGLCTALFDPPFPLLGISKINTVEDLPKTSLTQRIKLARAGTVDTSQLFWFVL